MHFLNTIFLPLLALAALAHGAPAKDERVLEDAPAYFCAHIHKGMYSRYVLRAREWYHHEEFLMAAVRKSEPNCLVTNWRFREVPRNDSSGLVQFDMMFDMPILCQKRVEKNINGECGFPPAGKGGVECPEIEGTPELKKLHDELGARRPHQSWMKEKEREDKKMREQKEKEKKEKKEKKKKEKEEKEEKEKKDKKGKENSF